MLVLKRKEGQWTEVSIPAEKLKELAQRGESVILRFRVYNVGKQPGLLDIAFEDEPRNFDIQRPERVIKQEIS